MTADDVTVEPLRSGAGVRIHVSDDASDSLAIIEVTNRYGVLAVRAGLRGNFDANHRPLRWMTATMDAPKVSARERLERFWRWCYRRNVNRDDDALQDLLRRLRIAVADEADQDLPAACTCSPMRSLDGHSPTCRSRFA